MRVLVLDGKRDEREALMRPLPHESYRVEAVVDESAALAAIARECPQVVLFAVPAKGGPDLARRLRSADSSGEAYLLAVLDADPPGKEIANLIAAGVQDFMRRPILDAEVLERVKAPGRLARWLRSVAKPAAFDFSATPDLNALRAWTNLGALVGEDLSQLAGQPFIVSDGWPRRFAERVQSATILMSLAGDQLEVRLSIVVDELTLSWLREAILGDQSADEAATRDALREFANTAGGAFKRAALSESVTFTTGVPTNDETAPLPGEFRCWTIAAGHGDGCIAVVGEIRRRENQRVSASKLAEGMVVAHDLRNEGGILLVPAGSRLTRTSAAKLAQMLGSRFFLEVALSA